MTNVIKMPGISELPRSARALRSHMDTMELTPKGVRAWKRPPFQRELRVNKKVQVLAEEIRLNDGVVPGTITLGRLDGDTYLVDGQHRSEAYLLSEMPVGYADVRICEFETMSDMSEEFVRLNSSLVRMRNDDIIRGLEAVIPQISAIRRKCPFIGYDGIRRSNVMVSMATVLRIWFGSASVTPTPGPASTEATKLLNDEQAALISTFMTTCYEAWGKDKSNHPLWSSINLGILMWLWRRIVHGKAATTPLARHNKISSLQFQSCLMGLAADPKYSEWLIGRSMRDRDRAPCYARIRDLFNRRLAGDGLKLKFPHEAWTKA